jgi:hypothetical protein
MCVQRLCQRSGRTVRAALPSRPDPLLVANTIATKLSFRRIFNVQFSLQDETPFIYDLNPRFGHSELFRAAFGFNFISAFLGKSSSTFAAAPIALDEDEAIALLQREVVY